MSLFVWRSVALQNYGPGAIVVEAPGAPEARHKAIAEYENFLAAYYDWADEEYLNEKRESFRRDLEEEYEELEVVLIPGSE